MFGKKKVPDVSQTPATSWGGEFTGDQREPGDRSAGQPYLGDSTVFDMPHGAPTVPAPAHGQSTDPGGQPSPTGPTGPTDQDVPLDPFTAVTQRLAALEDAQSGHIADLTAQLGEKDRVLTAMNDAVAASRRDQIATLLTPAAKKLIDLEHQLRHAATQQDGGRADPQVTAEFDYFAEKLDEALEALGFEQVAASPGEAFDARRHRAVKTSGTADPELDRTIAAVIRPGYAFTGAAKTAFPASVIVNGYDDSLPVDTLANDTTTNDKEN